MKEKLQSWWLLTVDQIEEILASHSKEGLSQESAEHRRLKYGANVLPAPKTESLIFIFLAQFNSFIIWVLIAAALIAGYLGEWVDSIAIITILIMNAVLGFVQDWRSIRSMESLTKLEQHFAKVVRNGRLTEIQIEDVVPGDLLVVEAGDQVPADGRLVSAYQLSIQEAALTGESEGIIKDQKTLKGEHLPIGDRTNMIYRGTTVSNGKGVALVTETGLNTEIGHIAKLLESIEKGETPLQTLLARLGRKLVWLCLAIVCVIFFLGYWKGIDTYQMLMISLSLAVAAIPEGLPAVVTISLAIGMQRMAKRQVLIRRLSAVETLGCTTVICTDKTGTLTENTMRVKELWLNERHVEMTGNGNEPQGEFLFDNKTIEMSVEENALLLEIGAVCNGASLERLDGEWKITGDPTEAALLVAAKQAGISFSRSNIVDEIPFDSERRMMSVIVNADTGRKLLLKGAPESVLPASTSVMLNGKKRELTAEKRAEIGEVLEGMAARGLRVLAMATRALEEDQISEENLTFVGLVAMQDPPRKEVKLAIRQCLDAGIQPVMVTGDHKETARAIGRELCLEGRGVDGSEIELLSDEELVDVQVFSRVSAQHKMRIVNAIQDQGQVVAMTGDGVNDAPAIEKADIGVAMGITGTDVTKSVSDMVILDDNFESIVAAVEEGRGIYDNMVKFISYLLSCNLAEILVIFFSLFFITGEASLVILAPIHLLWINLITDGLPAVALAMDPISSDAMKQPPRDPKAPFLSRTWLMKLATLSGIIAVIILSLFFWISIEDPMRARTVAFTALVILELSKAFILRLPYRIPMFCNRYLISAVILSLALQVVILYVPFFHEVLKTVPLLFTDWMWILGGVLALWLTASPLMKRN